MLLIFSVKKIGIDVWAYVSNIPNNFFLIYGEILFLIKFKFIFLEVQTIYCRIRILKIKMGKNIQIFIWKKYKYIKTSKWKIKLYHYLFSLWRYVKKLGAFSFLSHKKNNWQPIKNNHDLSFFFLGGGGWY